MSQHSNQLPTQPTSNLTAEWQIKSLKDVADFANGKPYEGHIDADGRYALITLDSVDIKGRLKDSHRMTNVWDESLQAGDIVSVLSDLAHGLLLGMSAVIPADGTYVLNQRMGRLRLKVPGNSDFVRLQINARQEHFRKRGQGTSQRHIYKRDFESLEIPFPAPKEQDTIATALSDVDALIAGLERLIAKKRDIKQAAMQQLLTGQTRLPGFSGEWERKLLGAACTITTGKKDVNEGDPNGQFPFFTCSRTHTFSQEYSFDTEAILIAGNGEVGNLHFFSGKFEAYQRTYVLFDFSVHVGFLWQQLSNRLAESLGLGKIGSSIPYIKRENLTDFEFFCPQDPAEQTAVSTTLSEMDAELAALESRIAKTRAIKQGMMQELLTGRTRLV